MLGHTERRLNNNVIVLRSAVVNVFSRTMENAEKLRRSQKRNIIEDIGYGKHKRRLGLFNWCFWPDT